MKNYKKDVAEIDKTNIVGIRTYDFNDFLDIWVVAFDERLFARSWSRLKDSWFFAFKEKGKGLLKCGKKIYEVTSVVPDDLEMIAPDINNAYERRYGQGSQASIAKSMQDVARLDMTMEFKIAMRIE
ncbi:MAG: DUF2255 family protein [Thermodesulfobacteriota bacterium]